MPGFRNNQLTPDDRAEMVRWTRWMTAIYGVVAIALLVFTASYNHAGARMADPAQKQFKETGHPAPSTLA